MSGAQLTALGATVVALVALVGVGVLVLEVRRLRADVTAGRSGRTPRADATVSSGEQAEPAGATAAPSPVPRPEADARLAPVVELVPVPSSEPDDGVPSRELIVAARFAQPLVRVSAAAYGVRRALRPENRDRVVALVRRDLRRRHRTRRRAGRRAYRVVSIRPAGEVAPGDGRQESAS